MAALAPAAESTRGFSGIRAVPKTFLVWAYLTIGLAFAATYIPTAWPLSTAMRNGSVASGVLWIGIALFRLRLELRICFPVIMLMLLQVWGAISSAYASTTVGRSIPFNYSDVIFLRYIYLFIIGALLIQIDNRHRRYVLNFLVGYVALNAVIQYLQFLHFGPALALANASPFGIDITNWNQRGGTRAVGFMTFPGPSAIVDAMMAAWYVGQLAHRKLRLYEHFLFFFFVGASLIAQARTHLPGLAIVVLFYVLFLIRSERERAPAILVGMTAAVGTLIVLAWDRLAYTFGESFLSAGNLKYRSSFAWNQTDLIQRDFPWTGVGPDPSILTNLALGADKWSPRVSVEQGWLALQAQYGMIGLAMGVLAFVALIASPFAVNSNKSESNERKSLTISLALMGVCVAIGMMGNTVLHWEGPFFMLMLVGGTAMRNFEEERAYKQHALRARYAVL